MRRSILAGLVILLGITCAQIAISEERPASKERWEHAEWIAKLLKQIETVSVGMTRQDLLGVFTTEGGISSRQQRTYVHRECPYIKVDVRFKPVSPGYEENSRDQITEISRPYLQLSILD